MFGYTPLLAPRRARMLLQMAIFLKARFSVLYFSISMLLLIEKLQRLRYATALGRSLHIASFVFLLVTDAARYWLGSHGNLKQQVFHLTAFLFLSVCPMLPALLYFDFFNEHALRFDAIAGGCFMTLLCWETLLAVVVLKEMLRQETTRFVRLREAVKDQGGDENVETTTHRAAAC